MVITYNHARFIEQCLQGILSQETDFPVTVHVIDDCSTDGAQEIIRSYAAKHPGVIKPMINARNIGSKVTQRNFYRGFRTLDGDFISIIEGDDYWTDNSKLQTQIDFLEAHSDFVACAHNVTKIYEEGDTPSHLFLPPPQKPYYDINDLIHLRAYFHTSSLTYRNVLRGRVPSQFSHPLSCDLFITAAHAQHGKIHFDSRAMSVYRAHSGGVFSGLSETKGWIFNIDGMRRYNYWLGYRYWREYVEAIYLYCEFLLRNGKAADGLTRWTKIKYGTLGKAYRQLHRWGAKVPST